MPNNNNDINQISISFQFSLLLFVIVILEALVALSGYYLKNDIDLMLQTKMNETISDYGKNPEITKSWDILQLDVSNHPLVNMYNGTYY